MLLLSQGFEKAHQVANVLGAQVQRLEYGFPVGVQTIHVDMGVVLHDIFEGLQAAIVHVWCGTGNRA